MEINRRIYPKETAVDTGVFFMGEDAFRNEKVSKGQMKFFFSKPKKMKGNGGKMNIFKAVNSIYMEKFSLTSRG